MGEIIQFPGNYQGGEGELERSLTPEEQAVVDRARSVFGTAVAQAAKEVSNSDVEISLNKGASTDEGWEVITLEP